jgi:transposase
MPAALRIILTTEENKTLQELEVADSVPRRTKQRATALRLNATGWKVKQIADYLAWAESTVRQTIHRWNQNGLVGLWEAVGRGKKPSWIKEDWDALEQWLTEPRSLSSRQLSQRLARERQVLLGAEQVRRILKKKSGDGKDSGENLQQLKI